MEKFDIAIIGGFSGVAGLAIADICFRRTGVKCIFINCDSKKDAATLKGIKLVNHVIPKLPYITAGDMEQYKDILDMLDGSVSYLERQYEGIGIHPYKGPYKALRECRTQTEVEILKALKIPAWPLPNEIFNTTSSLVEQALGEGLKKELIYSYEEHMWDVSSYLDRYISNLEAYESVMPVNTVKIIDINDSVKLEMTIADQTKIICANKVLVCKGMGNLEFEKINKTSFGEPSISWPNLKYLQYYKSIYGTNEFILPDMSNLFMPQRGICFTNESKHLQGVLFDTNGRAISASRYNESSEVSILEKFNTELHRRYDVLGKNIVKEFICAMPVYSPEGLSIDHRKHFEFIITPSFNNRVLYFNLTYFTAIGAASQKFEDQFKKIIYD